MARQVSNKKQLSKLVELMESDTTLAKGILSKNMRQQRWEPIAVKLNSYGPPMKSWDKWYKVWSDMKSKIKIKVSHNRNELRATGGGPNTLHALSPLESAVDDLLNISRCVDPPGIQFGYNIEGSQNTEMVSESNTPDDMLENLTPENVTAATSAEKEGERSFFGRSTQRNKRNAARRTKVALLEHQTSYQQQFYKEAMLEMEKVTAGLKDMTNAINNMANQQTAFLKELIDLKKEEVKWAKDVYEQSK